ncbi:MAG: hypothetical protein K0R93_1394 [Anaerosolibacter sp.]|jgi:putative inorganic carbon (HCO3(-)) transporter|uniref:O-antigen ligase family protein n=1 Tax=Anaerosolibacter sp. TaxID=1872527 RepID=UPI0026284D0E|nr:O-antigen ligase family protein [Anaerosolibacter sp.]MDF2546496.1 hypothetical protein [Anaerosolibacter sp.]
MDSDKILNNLLTMIISITPLIIAPFYMDYFYYPKMLFVYVTASALSIIWFLNRKSNNIKIDLIEKMIVIYLILIVTSTFFSVNIGRSTWGNSYREEGIFAIIVYVFMFILVRRKYQFSKAHVSILLLSASLVALYGISQYFGYDPIPRDPFRVNWKGRAFSTMGNPNFLGAYLTLILPISAFAYVYSKKAIYLIASGVLYLSLLCTMTRGSWVGAFFSFIIFIWFSYRHKYSFKHLAIILSLFLVITILVNIHSDGRVFGRFLTITKDMETVISQSSGYERAGANRIFIWERVIELIKLRPILGYGLETLGVVFTDTYREDIMTAYKRLIIFDKAHNEYLHIAVSTGIPSLLLYLAFVSSIVYKAFKSEKNNPLIIPLLCSIIGYLVQAFFNISVVSVAYIYWMFLGILLKFSLDSSSVSSMEQPTTEDMRHEDGSKPLKNTS